MSAERSRAYEASFTADGRLEISEYDEPDRWIATDAPVECRR
ncbi:hypothetical protein ACLI4U_15265 [Natrialbaceae archaeon A-CW2]|nr:hypothetical protein [Natronosalvus amylolyticus]